jgi:Transposase DNA-binding/Transposase Tn5 dimerisation domain
MNAASLRLEADVWSAEIAAHADLPDERLNRRLAEIVATFADKPLDSIPQAFGCVSGAKAAYRFFQNKRVTVDNLLGSLTSVTAEHCRGQAVVLSIQDTTSANYSTLTHTTGLGPLSNSDKARGMLVHTTMAVRPNGVPIGLLHQEYWSRPTEKRAVDEHKLPIEEKESRKWLHGIAGANAALDHLPEAERPRLIHLMDREGDIHEVLEIIAASPDGAIIRSTYNRQIAGPIQHAHDAVAAAKLLGTTVIDAPASHGQPKRKARLEIRSITVTITPSCAHAVHANRKPVTWSLVEAREIDAPAGVEALHWLLWTTEPATTLAEALEILRLYKLRWRIEDFHLTLKSGCRAEALELETADRLAKALTIYSAVAVRIVTLRDLARQDPDAPCTTILSDDAWKALWIHFNKKRLTANTPVPTIKQAILWIGRLGGHLNRKRDGMPGVRTLWRGWRDLTILVAGYRLVRDAG